MKKTFLILLAISIILVAAFVLYIKSPSFLNLVERVISSRIEGSIEIGSLSITEGNRIIISNVTVKERGGRNLQVILPRLEVVISLSGLLDRSIDEIILEKPEISFSVKKKEGPLDRGVAISFPFSLNRVSVDDAVVSVKREGGSSLHINPVNISLEATDSDGAGAVSGSAFIQEINSTVSLEAVVDMDMFTFERIHIAASRTDLEPLFDEEILALPGGSRITGHVTMDIDLVKEEGGSTDRFRWQSTVSLSDLSIHSRTIDVNLKDRPLGLTSKGLYDLQSDHMEIEFLHVQLSRFQPWVLRGTLGKIYSGNPRFNLQAETGEIPVDAMKEIISGPAVAWLDGIDTDGFGKAGFSVTGSRNSPAITGVLSLYGKQLTRKDIVLESFTMNLPVVYRNKHFTLKDVLIKIKDVTYNKPKEKDVHIRLLNVKLLVPDFAYDGSGVKSDALKLTADQIYASDAGKKYFSEEDISLEGALEGNLEDRKLKLYGLSMETDFIKDVSGDISLTLGKPVIMDAVLAYQNIDIENVLQKFPPDFIKDKTFSAHGNAAIHTTVKLKIPDKGRPGATGNVQLTLEKAGFSSSDETKIGEGIEMKVSGSFEFPLPVSNIDFNMRSETTGFELLAGRFYGNFADKVLSFSSKARYTKAGGLLSIAQSELGLTDMGTVNVTGQISDIPESPLFNGEINLANLSNREAFNFFIRETFQEEFPLLAKLDISGMTSVKLAVRGRRDKFTAQGDLIITGMDIQGRGPEEVVTGINVALPVHISFPEESDVREIERFGSLRIKNLFWKALHVNDLEASPSLWRNALIFHDDIILKVYGGNIILGNMSYTNIFSEKRNLSFSIDVNDIDLARASVALDIPRFEGILTGAIPSVNLIENQLITEGEVFLDIFGGKIKIGDLSVDNVFSPIASLKSRIELEGIDLGMLTSTFDFGHISGIVQGSVQDLVIVNGQAERFKASLETVKKKGIKQRVNVKALKKISILGTGSSVTVLDRGIYQFLKEYRYEKMGFKAHLRNDNLLLLGIDNRGNKSYLVKGGILPPKVDVINYNQNISFKEMVKRLKRIKQVK